MQRMTDERYRSLMLSAVRILADKRGVMISKLPPETLRRFGIIAKKVEGEIRSCMGYDVKIPKRLPEDLCSPELWMVVRYIESYGMKGISAKPVPKRRGRPKAREPLEEPLEEHETSPGGMTGRDARKLLGH